MSVMKQKDDTQTVRIPPGPVQAVHDVRGYGKGIKPDYGHSGARVHKIRPVERVDETPILTRGSRRKLGGPTHG